MCNTEIFIFIPTLHVSHWVFWMKMHNNPTNLDAQKVNNHVVFCNPMYNPATHGLKRLVEMDVRMTSSMPEDHCIILENHELHIPTQSIGVDQIHL